MGFDILDGMDWHGVTGFGNRGHSAAHIGVLDAFHYITIHQKSHGYIMSEERQSRNAKACIVLPALQHILSNKSHRV